MRSSNVGISHLERDHPQSENVQPVRREAGFCFSVDSKELGCHPSLGSPEPILGNIRIVEVGDGGEPEVTETCTARPINENIILKREMVATGRGVGGNGS